MQLRTGVWVRTQANRPCGVHVLEYVWSLYTS